MSFEFLELLEGRVREVAERLEELAVENARLKEEIEHLERNKSAAQPAKNLRSSDPASKAWAKEREEIRGRLEALVERLSALLDGGRGAPR